MSSFLTRNPFALLLLSAIAGVLCSLLPVGYLLPIATLAAGSALAVMQTLVPDPALIASPSRLHRIMAYLPSYVWIFLIGFSFSLISALSQKPGEYDFENDILPPYASGTVKSVRHGAYENFTVRIDRFTNLSGSEITEGNLEAELSTEDFIPHVGERIVWIHALRKDTSAYGRERIRQFVEKEDVVSIVPHDRTAAFFSGLRDDLAVRIEKSSLDRDTAAFLIAMILGDRSSLPENIRDDFSLLGIAHILALSGLHLGIITLAFMLLLYPLKIFGYYGQKTRIAIVIAAVWLYAVLTGMAGSVTRAAVMTTFYLSALLIERKNSPLNALMGAGFFILIFSPSSLFDAGVQLSFVTVLVLILYADRVNFIDRRNHPYAYWLVGLAGVAAVAYAGSAALSIYYFHRLPLLSVPLNILAAPLIPVFVGTGLLYTVLLAAGIDFIPAAWLLAGIMDLLQSFTDFFKGSGFAGVNAAISGIAVFAVLCALVVPAVVSGWRRKRRYMAYGCAAAAVILAVVIFPGTPPREGIEISSDPSGNIVNIVSGYSSQEIDLQHRSAEQIVESGGIRIVGIDSPYLPVADSRDETRKVNYALIGHGFKGDLQKVAETYLPEKIVLMKSLSTYEEEKLAERASEIGVKCHSIRESGALFIPFRR